MLWRLGQVQRACDEADRAVLHVIKSAIALLAVSHTGCSTHLTASVCTLSYTLSGGMPNLEVKSRHLTMPSGSI